MKRKICVRPQCGKIYRENEEGFEKPFCSLCAAPLEFLEDTGMPLEDSESRDEQPPNNEEGSSGHFDDEMFDEDGKMKTPSQESSQPQDDGDDEDSMFDEFGRLIQPGVTFESVPPSYGEEDDIVSPEYGEELFDDAGEEENMGPEEVSEGEGFSPGESSSSPFEVDAEGFIHFSEDGENPAQDMSNIDEYEGYLGDRLIIYKDGKPYKTVPLLYDETIIGRRSTQSNPDVDLTSMDPTRRISRRHAMIYRNHGGYYIKNLSGKNPLHINTCPLLQDEVTELEEGSKIILSSFIGISFHKSTEGGEEHE